MYGANGGCKNDRPVPSEDNNKEVNEGQKQVDRAHAELNGAKNKVKNAVKQITKILMDELGVTAALDCFSSGDLGSCGETALNIAGSFAGGIAGKVLAKYGLPGDWAKAASLLKKLTGLAGDLISGAKAWYKASEKVEKAKGALAAIKARLKGSRPAAHSFLAGTKVLMADGSARNIEDVAVGDVIVTTDTETGEGVVREVAGTIVTQDDKAFVDLTVAGVSGDASLVTTVTHPFWVENEGRFVEAGDLQPGMLLRTPEGTTVPLKNLRLFEQRQKTYDLTVTGIHAYYVFAGDIPLLVHNAPLCKDHGGDTGSPDGPGIVPGNAPQKAHDMLAQLNARPGGTGKIPGYEGGGNWGNGKGQLPTDVGKYKEFDVNAIADNPVCSVSGCGKVIRGPERLVVTRDGGAAY
ncbi:polymorphic toxin-type HINT domain-containing protein [Streptomyces erythrochromogenes]|uniref:polymorphic toxin-type HINT domain-containing protein n=1 Tax=Streptomyces erythrochromogenes TaxID=285574 RepID=UPI0036B3CF9F